MKYKLQEITILDTEFGMSIPMDEGNRHYKEYLEWVSEGNTPDPEFSDVEIESERVADIKQIANQQILELMPEWRQRNSIARMLELISKAVDLSVLTLPEQDEIAASTAEWDVIKTIRETSNNAEKKPKEA